MHALSSWACRFKNTAISLAHTMPSSKQDYCRAFKSLALRFMRIFMAAVGNHSVDQMSFAFECQRTHLPSVKVIRKSSRGLSGQHGAVGSGSPL